MTEQEIKNLVEQDFIAIRERCQVVLNNPASTQNELRLVQAILILCTSILTLLDYKQHKPNPIRQPKTIFPFCPSWLREAAKKPECDQQEKSSQEQEKE